jgi:hypothetical protein
VQADIDWRTRCTCRSAGGAAIEMRLTYNSQNFKQQRTSSRRREEIWQFSDRSTT